jgi:hypothetical protein
VTGQLARAGWLPRGVTRIAADHIRFPDEAVPRRHRYERITGKELPADPAG